MDWEYPAGTEVALFRLYAATAPGAYRFGQRGIVEGVFVPGGYVATVESLSSLTTILACQRIYLPTGTYSMVVTAVTADQLVESAPSNEVQMMVYGPSGPPAPGTPPPVVTLPPPAAPTVPPAPPPLGPQHTYQPPPPPVSSGSVGKITETCQWRGNCPR